MAETDVMSPTLPSHGSSGIADAVVLPWQKRSGL